MATEKCEYQKMTSTMRIIGKTDRINKDFFEEGTNWFSCVLCGGQTSTNQKKHARGQRHQNLVQAEEERVEIQRERITKNDRLNQSKANRPKIPIEPIIEEPQVYIEEFEPPGSEYDAKSDHVPDDLYEDGTSEHAE